MGRIQTQPFEVFDFTGGITDHIYVQNPSKSQVVDNLILLSNKTLMLRPGSIIDNDTPADDQIPAGNQRIGGLINYDNSKKLFVLSARNFYYRNPSAYATLVGPTGNVVYSIGSVNNSPSFTQWNGHILTTNDEFPRPMQIYRDDLGAYQVRTAGLPPLASAPIVTAGAAGTRNYIYAFHYSYEYMVNDQNFRQVGPVIEVELNNSGDPSVNPNAISAIPVITNGLTDNWDVTVIKVEIYRTIDGGTLPFFIGQVTNGTTIFSDNVSDATASDNAPIYIADGTLDHDPAPVSKFVHVTNNTALWAHISEGGFIYPNRYRQSIPFAPWTAPGDFEDQVEDEIVGLSSVNSIHIIFCKRHVYRVEGQFDQFGRGSLNHIRISDHAGCVSNLSVVQAEMGLFWAGNDGFYYTDGYQVQKISDDNNENYKAMLAATTMQKRIYGKFDELDRRILWAIERDSGSLDNDACFVLDLRWAIRADSTFTSWSGASFAPTSLEFFDGNLYRANKNGYVFIHSDDQVTDPKVDTTEDAEDWHKETILYEYRTIAYNFGSNFERKWVPRFLLTAKNKSDISIQVTAINDDGKLVRPLHEIRWRKNFTWGNPEFVWGDPSCVWNAQGLIEQWRRLPAVGLRISYIQFDIANSYTVITNSDTLGTANFDPTLNTATLDIVASDWPVDSVDYFISTEVDQYEKQYLITNIVGDTIDILDTDNTLPVGSLKWLIKGKRKGEVLNLLSYTIHWASLSKTQATFETGQDGGNST